MIPIPIIDSAIALIKDGLDRFIPDKTQAAQAKAALDQLRESTEAQQMLAQAQIDLAEAQSPERFKSYWRPAVGWICVAGMLFQFVIAPLVTWGAALAHSTVTFPVLDSNTLMTLLFAMLGVGTLRTVDKVKGVA